ncbi:MAG: hypothetical protein U9Q98_12875 [Bacteroidota bacterium]|nr:hypothetical protein [Bacteroidota bacterium]
MRNVFSFIFLGFLFCFQPAFAAKWEKATVITKKQDTLYGEIKARKRNFSTFIKFRDAENKKMHLKPDYIQRVITKNEVYEAIYFNKELIGYNVWCFGKVITQGDISIFDVHYPYKSCACKTAGSYHHHWVLKAPDKPLFIIGHNFLSKKINNINAILDYFGDNQEVKDTLFTFEGTRSEFKNIIEHINQKQQETNRTYSQEHDYPTSGKHH